MRTQMFYVRDRLILKLLYLINGQIVIMVLPSLKKPNISPAVFLLILRYIYTGILDLINQSSFNILALLVACDELMLDKLVNHVQKHLINQESTWLQKNFIFALHTVLKLQSCKEIQEYIMTTICEDPQPFFELKEFPTLNKDILLSLVKRDDLIIEEIDIWKYLLKWGTAQSVAFKESSKGKSQEIDVTKWKDNDFSSLKKSLDPFIPYIRFHEISREDFYHHIRPYKKAIPENIYEDIVAYLMVNIMPKFSTLPSRCGSVNIDSVIIERNKAAVITNWIEKRTTLVRKPFYRFTLTYRATRDGFNFNTFNAKNQNNAVLGLIKIKDSKKIIGGYSPIGFKSRNDDAYYWVDDYDDYYAQWVSTNNSFIFCFGDEESSTVLSCVKDSSCAIYSCSGSWMNFGNSDLVLNGQNGSCSQCYYENKILDTNSFVVEELETFIVQKN
ncbi:serine-enriched protein [Gigaspora margarita]|nr:serine-enriched protein [Gigaspora margarita]